MLFSVEGDVDVFLCWKPGRQRQEVMNEMSERIVEV